MSVLRISQHMNNFHLHDGAVENINYNILAGDLDILAELANTSPAEIGSRGMFRFLNVSLISSDEPMEKIDWEQSTFEIIRVMYSPEYNQDKQEGITWILRKYITGTGSPLKYDILEIKFIASGFIWQKDEDNQDI